MKKILILLLCIGMLGSLSYAKKPQGQADKQVTVANTEKSSFMARRKQIKQLIKKYKKAPANEKSAIKAELTQVVSVHVDAQLAYMKERIAAERANLDNWEKKIQEDEKNLEAVKAQRVDDLLSGEAKKKQKAAKKAWKKQMKAVKK